MSPWREIHDGCPLHGYATDHEREADIGCLCDMLVVALEQHSAKMAKKKHYRAEHVLIEAEIGVTGFSEEAIKVTISSAIKDALDKLNGRRQDGRTTVEVTIEDFNCTHVEVGDLEEQP